MKIWRFDSKLPMSKNVLPNSHCMHSVLEINGGLRIKAEEVHANSFQGKNYPKLNNSIKSTRKGNKANNT